MERLKELDRVKREKEVGMTDINMTNQLELLASYENSALASVE